MKFVRPWITWPMYWIQTAAVGGFAVVSYCLMTRVPRPGREIHCNGISAAVLGLIRNEELH